MYSIQQQQQCCNGCVVYRWNHPTNKQTDRQLQETVGVYTHTHTHDIWKPERRFIRVWVCLPVSYIYIYAFYIKYGAYTEHMRSTRFVLPRSSPDRPIVVGWNRMQPRAYLPVFSLVLNRKVAILIRCRTVLTFAAFQVPSHSIIPVFEYMRSSGGVAFPRQSVDRCHVVLVHWDEWRIERTGIDDRRRVNQ